MIVVKVTLINPPGGLRKEVIGSMGPPLGLAYIAAVLENSGIETEIIDMQILDLKPSDVEKKNQF